MDSDLKVPEIHGKASNRILSLVSLNHFVNDGSTALISSLFPAVTVAFGFSKFEVGILVAAGYLVNMIFQPLTGRYSERLEPRKLLALGISLIGFSMVMFIVSSTFALMLLSIMVLRFGSSFFHPVGVSAISRNYTGHHLDRAMGIQSAFGNLGILLVFLVSAPIYILFGWQAPFLIFAVFDLVTVSTTLLAFSKRNTTAYFKPAQSVEEDSKTSQETQFAEKGKVANRLSLPLFFVAAAFISGGSFAVFVNYGNQLLYQDNFGLGGSNFLMAVWVASAFFGAVLTGLLTRKLTRRRLLPLSFFLASASALGFAMFSSNAALIVAALLVNGFSISVTYPAVYSELSAHLGVESKRKGTAFGMLFSSQIAGSSVMGFLSGYLAGIFGLTLDFILVFILLAFAAAVSYVWTRKA